MTTATRHNVRVSGPPSGPPIVFAHGFGCDQQMWRYVAPRFEADHRVVLFDHMGSGRSDLRAYDPVRYAALDGYAQDVLAILEEFALRDAVFVGHSVSAMIGVLAAIARPELFAALVLIGPSPRYVDDGDYEGGFTREDIEDLLSSLESNFLGWSATMAPVIMGNPDRPELAHELEGSFCANDPEIAAQFARVTFLSDNRADLARCATPALVLQLTDDVIAPRQVGEYVHAHLPRSELRIMRATGHCPQLSAPDETTEAIRTYLGAGAR